MNDSISRQAAIETVKKHYRVDNDLLEVIAYEIEALPSAQLAQDLPNGCTDTISRQAAINALKNRWKKTRNYEGIGDDIAEECELYLKQVPSAQPGQRNARVFQGIIVEYPPISAYPEYEGKPYFSIKYTENGQEFIGYGTYKLEVLSEYLKEYFMPPTQPGWIPVTERLPENEQDVFVTVEVRLSGRKPFRRVVRAFYTDGRHTDADSAYSWDEFPDPQYDDDDNMIIPEGWWESSDYLEQQGMIDDFVMAWREPLKPWEGGTG